MSRNYYYTVCSLPAISLEAGQAPISWGDFLRLCAVEVPPRKLELFARLGLLPREDLLGQHPVLDRWILFEGSLRNALSRLRSRRLELPEDEYSRAVYPGNFPVEEAETVVNAETPLDAETRLERVRWNWLEELDNTSEFDLGRLIVYGLKLRVLERRTRFDRKAGESVLAGATDIPPPAVGTETSGRTS